MTLRERVLGRIREERERAEKATPGPWWSGYNVAETMSILSRGDVVAYPAVPERNPYHKAIDERDANIAFIASARTLLPALLSEAQRQVEEHEPGVLRDADLCCGCADPTRPEDCPVVLAWARVFGEGE